MPPLWLFTDEARVPDVLAAVDALPRGLCGVVFRHDGARGRAELARAVARRCRRGRLPMVVAGRPIPIMGTRRHLREGRGGVAGGTASAHGVPGLVRAARTGCRAVFLSPAFPTASHPGGRAWGAVRWAGLARCSRVPVLALGGIDGSSVRRLPRWVAGAGAIGALLA